MSETEPSSLQAMAFELEKARITQEKELARVQSETQAVVDKRLAELSEATSELFARYLAFKAGLWFSGERIGREIFPSAVGQPVESYRPHEVANDGAVLVFGTGENYSSRWLPVPFEYFDDPEAWEEKFMARLAEIKALAERASEVMPAEYEYSAAVLSFEMFNPIFRLNGKPKSSENGKSVSWAVDFKTGDVFHNHDATHGTPVANLRSA